MKITYLGHASLSIEVGGKHIIVDPYISANELASHIDIDELRADYILITHAHWDHVHDVEAIASRTSAIIVSNVEVANYYEKKGFKTHGMNYGGVWNFDFGRVKYVVAMHSSTFSNGAPGGNPGGFVIEGEHKNIYIAGDTSLTYDMKLIPLRTKLDLAVFPIGSNFTMGIEDAITASDFVECDKILGCHYDTFGYIKIDHEKAKRQFFDAGKDLMLLPIGDFIDL